MRPWNSLEAGNEMNDSLLHPPEANSVTRRIEATRFSGDVKLTC